MPEDARCALIPRITTAERQAQLPGEIIGEVGENRIGFGVDFGLGEGGQASEGREQANIEQGVGAGVEIIEADQSVELVAFIEQLEFLADLFVQVETGHVEIDRRQRVKIDWRCRVVLAPCADRPERDRVAQIGRDVHRQTISLDFLNRVVKTAAGIENIVQYRSAGDGTRD